MRVILMIGCYRDSCHSLGELSALNAARRYLMLYFFTSAYIGMPKQSNLSFAQSLNGRKFSYQKAPQFHLDTNGTEAMI